jgi:hypothetical protein
MFNPPGTPGAAVWLDVGAHLGEKTLAGAEQKPRGAGFKLVGSEGQSYNQEENLTFARPETLHSGDLEDGTSPE